MRFRITSASKLRASEKVKKDSDLCSPEHCKERKKKVKMDSELCSPEHCKERKKKVKKKRGEST